MSEAAEFLGDIVHVSDLIYKMHQHVITPNGGWSLVLMRHDAHWHKTFEDGSAIVVEGDSIIATGINKTTRRQAERTK